MGVMTFSRPRYNTKFDWEILRFTTHPNFRIVGGASKLFKFFVDNYNPESIITYSDRRFGEGNVYHHLGFTKTGHSLPNYFYFYKNTTVLHSRVKFQKHKLEKILDIFDPDLTEPENMYANGYYRIWDCGNNVYEWVKK